MSFFTQLISARVPENNRLKKLDVLVDWASIRKILTKRLGSRINPISGVKPYDTLCMFKALLLQTWHSLSDPELEEALRVRFDFILFCRFEVEDSIPDETTICRFRNRLVELGLDSELLAEINDQLEQKGIKVKQANGAVIDATIIQSAAKPGKQLEQIPEDRNEDEVVLENKHETSLSKFLVRESRDPDARWLKKGHKTYFGYKMFVSTESEGGFVEHVAVTSANQSEVSFLPTFLEGMKNHPGRRIYGDKGYASKANRELLKSQGLKDGLMEKASRGKVLRALQKIKNKLISKKRFIIEQTFGTLKRRLLFTRAKYYSLEKVRSEAIRKALCLNLIKATNKIRLNLQNQEKLVVWG